MSGEPSGFDCACAARLRLNFQEIASGTRDKISWTYHIIIIKTPRRAKIPKTGRHNKFNRAFYNAVSAQATTSVILGDKGDGSPRARADALARYAHYSADPRTTSRT